MSDELIDAGSYPPKGYGWYSMEARKRLVVTLLKQKNPDKWVLDEAKVLKIKLKDMHKKG